MTIEDLMPLSPSRGSCGTLDTRGTTKSDLDDQESQSQCLSSSGSSEPVPQTGVDGARDPPALKPESRGGRPGEGRRHHCPRSTRGGPRGHPVFAGRMGKGRTKRSQTSEKDGGPSSQAPPES